MKRSASFLPVGPQGHVQFSYSAAPAIFGGRTEYGPPRLGLDTNVLIDLTDGAQEILDGFGGPPNPFAAPNPRDWEERSHCLRDIVNLWMWRDVRFHVEDFQLHDAKKELKGPRAQVRRRLLDALYVEGRERDEWGDAIEHEAGGRPGIGQAELPGIGQAPVAGPDFIPQQMDRLIVQASLVAGCHVFLTEDRKHILKHSPRLRLLGLAAITPEELLRELHEVGELEPDRCTPDLFPDNHGWVHLLAALEHAAATEPTGGDKESVSPARKDTPPRNPEVPQE